MSDIFISYASADRECARALAVQLERLGWSVWWDRDIQAGKTFAGVIESEINRARCVIVLWSHASVDSRWVRDEANEGLKRDALVPVFIESVSPPLGFRSIHAADLNGWQSDPQSQGFRDLVRDLAGVLGPPPAGDLPPTDRGQRPRPRTDDHGRKRPPWLIPAVAAMLVLVIGAGGVAYFSAGPDAPAPDATEAAQRRAEEDAAKQRAALDAQRRDLEAQRAELEAARRAQAEMIAARKRADDEAAAREAEAERRAAAEAEAARKLQAEKARLGDAEAVRRQAEAARRAAAEDAARKAEAERDRLAAAKEAKRLDEARKAQAAAAARAKEAERAERDAARALAAKNPEMLPSVGDSWTYRFVDGFQRSEVARLTYRVEDITGDGLKELLKVSTQPDFASRVMVNRAPGFPVRSGLKFAPPDLAPYLQAFYGLQGEPLPTVSRRVTSDANVDMRMRVVGSEAVTVPAGRFDAIKVEAEGRGYTLFKQLQVHSIITIWYAPKVKRFVKYTAQSFEHDLPLELSTFELVEYRVSP